LLYFCNHDFIFLNVSIVCLNLCDDFVCSYFYLSVSVHQVLISKIFSEALHVHYLTLFHTRIPRQAHSHQLEDEKTGAQTTPYCISLSNGFLIQASWIGMEKKLSHWLGNVDLEYTEAMKKYVLTEQINSVTYYTIFKLCVWFTNISSFSPHNNLMRTIIISIL
jgi:hypothetical protein